MTRTTPPSLDDPPPGTSGNSRTQFAFIPRFIQQQQQQQQQPPLSASTSSSQQQQQTFGQRFKAALPFPRFYSGPSATIGPITPPITFHDPSNSSAFSSSSTSTSSASILPSPLPTPTSTSCRGIGESAAAAAQKPTKRRRLWDSTHVIHDAHCCMFRITLDSKGTIAALCYLPTRFQGLIEFYHTEIPIPYRGLGIGDVIATQAFRWAEACDLLVIPSCPFVKRHLAKHTSYNCVVKNEDEGQANMIQNRYHLLLDLYMYGAIAVSIKECAAEKDNAPGDESRAACTGLNDILRWID